MNGNTWEKMPAALLQAPANHLKVWHAIALHCIDKPTCFPGIPLLAKETGYCERQVRRILKEMVTSGLLARNHSNGHWGELKPLVPESYQQPRTSKSPVMEVPGDTGVPSTPDISVHKPRTCTSAEVELLNRTKKKEQEPPLIPPQGESAAVTILNPGDKPKKKRATLPELLKDPIKLQNALAAIDLEKHRERWEPEGVDVRQTFADFSSVMLEGTAKRPIPNPYNYRDLDKAFGNWCSKRARDPTNWAPLPSDKKKPWYVED